MDSWLVMCDHIICIILLDTTQTILFSPAQLELNTIRSSTLIQLIKTNIYFSNKLHSQLGKSKLYINILLPYQETKQTDGQSDRQTYSTYIHRKKDQSTFKQNFDNNFLITLIFRSKSVSKQTHICMYVCIFKGIRMMIKLPREDMQTHGHALAMNV